MPCALHLQLLTLPSAPSPASPPPPERSREKKRVPLGLDHVLKTGEDVAELLHLLGVEHVPLLVDLVEGGE